MTKELTGHKGALNSKTVWGALIAFLPQLVSLIDQASSSGALPPIVTAIITAIGSGIAIYGRIVATKVISGA